MQVPRITSLLQGIASSRSWLLTHVPLTGSMAGYDLFLKIANDCPGGQPVRMSALLDGIGHPPETVRAQLLQMAAADLLAPRADDAWLPTARFLGLLNSFSQQFDSLFILRKSLRDRQLLVVSDDDELGHFAERLYDHFYDLGWLYLHNFGAACFLMASLVARLAGEAGYRARVASGYVDIARGDARYLLGAQGYAKPGQIDGHAVCVVEEKLLIDFGLGNARRSYRSDFPWALACAFRPRGACLAELAMPTGETVRWKNDWQSPDTEAELARYAPHLDQLAAQYHAQFR
ncbi:MAG: hypothetical protein QFF03_16070 [Pseudomonadota bacterium]|nr:hypothetical protein [Pseudomonadota bacterium]